jgi:hypothetical protein
MGWRAWIRWLRGLWPIELLQLSLDGNSNSFEKLQELLFPNLQSLRISESFADPNFATDLLERRPETLRRIESLGRDSFGRNEAQVASLLGIRRSAA